MSEIHAEEKIPEKFPQTSELWEQVGFHKPVAGFWHNLLLFLVEIILGIFISGAFMNFFYPFPESVGYQNTVAGLFSLLFFAFDIGTNSTLERFIAENRIKNPKRMVQFIQYFIWYQAITGLMQLTIIALYVFVYAQNSTMAYLAWIMLLSSTTQYPGFLGIFSGILGALQYYDKNNIINFARGQIIQRLTEFGFVYLGKLYGETHPEMGIIMGIALGAVLGKYIDDFFAMMLSAKFFSGAMKNLGIKPRDCFRVEFDWEIFKEAFIFGLKMSIPGLVSGSVSYYILLLFLEQVPQYITFVALQGIASGLTSYVNKGAMNIVPLYSEAYMNGKKKLCQYLLGQSWRYSGQMSFLFFTIFGTIYLFLPDAFLFFKIRYYMNAIPFIIPIIIATAITFFTNPSNQILVGADKPNVLFWAQMFEHLGHLIVHYLLIITFRVCDSQAGLIFTLVYARLIVWFVKDNLLYVYVQKNCFTMKIPWYQTFAAPILAFATCFSIGLLAKYTLYPLIIANAGFLPALISMIVILVILAVFCYFPLIVYFGGFDDETMMQFSKVVAMSGASKILVAPMFKIMLKVKSFSKLHNKFLFDSTDATRESNEIYQLKMKKLETLDA